MNTEEAYRALIEAIAAYVMAVAHDAASGTTKDSVGAKEDMIAAIRAYGAARALAAHVDACEHPPIRPTCGQEDAYCDVARKIREAR